MLRNIGLPELVLLLFLLLLLFGARRIPEIAESLGKAVRKFRQGTQEEDSHSGEKESEKNHSKDSKDSKNE